MVGTDMENVWLKLTWKMYDWIVYGKCVIEFFFIIQYVK